MDEREALQRIEQTMKAPPPGKNHDGPCRETAVSLLDYQIKQCQHRLAGLTALRTVACRAESGSPLEEALWELLQRPHQW